MNNGLNLGSNQQKNKEPLPPHINLGTNNRCTNTLTHTTHTNTTFKSSTRIETKQN